jgi:hypothetical protein
MAKASLFKEKHDTDNKPSCLISAGVKLNNTASIPAASLTAFGRFLPVRVTERAGQVSAITQQECDLRLWP